MIKLNSRQWIIGIALAATLLAMYFAPPKESEDLVEARKPVLKSNLVVQLITQPERLAAFNPNRIWKIDKDRDLFPANLKPIPVATFQSIQVPPPIPMAPPLPFTYIGKIIEEDKSTVFVSKQQKNYLLKGGEILEGMYKVDRVESGRVVFTYMPLETEQVMIIGGKD